MGLWQMADRGVIGGLWAASLALLSHAVHVFPGLFALGMSFVTLPLAALLPGDRHS